MPRLLDHYNEELRYLQEDGALFAKDNPQVAAQLGLKVDAVVDPFVERVLEGLAFLSARVHCRLDRQCAEFAHQAIARMAPEFANATPAFTSLAFTPDPTSPDSQRVSRIPAGSIVNAQLPGRPRPVGLSTLEPIDLLPLELASAQCSRAVDGLPRTAASRLARSHALIELNFNPRLDGGLAALVQAHAEAGTPDRLRLNLAGDAATANLLHRVLLTEVDTLLVIGQGERDFNVQVLAPHDLRAGGLGSHALHPEATLGAFTGLSLLRRYFANPTTCLAIELQGLWTALARMPRARSFRVVAGLRTQRPELQGRLDRDHFRLFASPAVNLYAKRLDPLVYDADRVAQPLVVDRMKPSAHHLYALSRVTAHLRQGEARPLMPVVGGVHFEDAVPEGHYGLFRHPIKAQQATAEDPLLGHDRLVVSLPGQTQALDQIASVHAEGLVCDRGWRPESFTDAVFSQQTPQGIGRIECLWLPSPPRRAPDLARTWDAAAYLAESPLEHANGYPPLDRLRNWARLATDPDDPLDALRLASLDHVSWKQDFQPCGRRSPSGWVRSQHVRLNILSSRHADGGAWLFGRVLAEALSTCAHLNDGLIIDIEIDGHHVSRHDNLARRDGGFA